MMNIKTFGPDELTQQLKGQLASDMQLKFIQ